jgi:RNA 3'-terminal phosphate cyclase (ATP)
MSVLTQQPLKVSDVREGTRYPGLDPEDLTIIHALAESCAAEVSGVAVGSGAFSFAPKRPPKGVNGRLATIRNESNRGPNALIVLTSLLPVMARTGVYSSLIAEGETYGLNALGFDGFANTTLGALKKLGLYAFASQEEPGFGRESRGEVALDIEPSEIRGIEWGSRGKLVELAGVVATSKLSRSVAERAISHLEKLSKGIELPLALEHSEWDTASTGCHITLWAHYERGFGGASAMGAKSIRVEILAQSAFDQLLEWMHEEACLDPYVADQILVPCVIAESPTTFSVSRLTQRLLTSIWVVKQFTPIHITVRGVEDGPGTVSIRH